MGFQNSFYFPFYFIFSVFEWADYFYSLRNKNLGSLLASTSVSRWCQFKQNCLRVSVGPSQGPVDMLSYRSLESGAQSMAKLSSSCSVQQLEDTSLNSTLACTFQLPGDVYIEEFQRENCLAARWTEFWQKSLVERCGGNKRQGFICY